MSADRLSTSKLIEFTRSRVAVCDLTGLEALAAGGYGLAEAEYARLIGLPLRKTRPDQELDRLQSLHR